MARVELLLKIGDSGGQLTNEASNWLDGMVIARQPPGFSVPPAEFVAWINDPGATPRDYGLWPRIDADAHSRRRDQIAYLTQRGLDPKEAAAIREDVAIDDPIWETETGREWIATAQKHIDTAVADLAYFSIHPYDLRWGTHCMREHGVLIVDLDELELLDLDEEAIDRRVHAYKRVPPEHRKRFRIPYETLLSGDTLRDWIDPRASVYPPRGEAPFTGSLKQDIKDRPPPPDRDRRA
jgi:hypothetical protein